MLFDPSTLGFKIELFQIKHLVLVHYCSTFFRLENLEEDIIEHNVKLVVLDSVASLVRKEFDIRARVNMMERTKLLGKQAALLKYIAETFHIPVSPCVGSNTLIPEANNT